MSARSRSLETGIAALERPIRVVSRLTLARWQIDRARDAGAVHLAERVNSVRRAGGRWRLETSERSVTARFLVGADGAASRVRRAATPKFQVELAPIRVWFDADDCAPTERNLPAAGHAA